MAIVFLQLSPVTSNGKLIYLRYDKMKIKEIKLIPYQCKRLLNKDKSSACPLLITKNTLFF